jgi:hypothetical protein
MAERGSGAVSYDSRTLNARTYVRPGNPVVAIAGALAAADLPSGRVSPGSKRWPLSGPEVVRTLDFDLAR